MKRSALLILFVFMFSAVAIADASASSGPTITLSGTGQNVPAQVIEQLVKDNPDAVSIRITKWTPSSSAVVSTRDFVGPPAWYYISTTKSVTQSNVTLDDRHIISCAKGVTKTLTATFSHTVNSEISLSASIGGEGIPAAAAADLGIASSSTVTITTTVSYSGPPEDSEANSREFRVRWYGDSGNWSGTLQHVVSGETASASGTWTGVVGSVEYAVDRFITPE